MKKNIKFSAIGMSISVNDGMSIMNPIPKLEADTKENLIKLVTQQMNDGLLSVDAKFITSGVVLQITIETSIDVDGDEYVNIKYQFDTVGLIADELYYKIQNYLLTK